MVEANLIITTNEPKEIIDLFPGSMTMPMDFDMLIKTTLGTVPIERKKVPGDLLASVSDGRLLRELIAMRGISQYYIVLLHGNIIYRRDGSVHMLGNKGRNWTKKGVRNLLRSLQFCEGAFLEYAETDEELIQVIKELQEYFNQQHLSLRHRPSIQSNWILPTRREKVMYFFQGLPGISTIRARALEERFPSPLNLYQATIEEIDDIPKFGKELATRIYNFLREG